MVSGSNKLQRKKPSPLVLKIAYFRLFKRFVWQSLADFFPLTLSLPKRHEAGTSTVEEHYVNIECRGRLMRFSVISPLGLSIVCLVQTKKKDACTIQLHLVTSDYSALTHIYTGCGTLTEPHR